jgi:hypothetical protein
MTTRNTVFNANTYPAGLVTDYLIKNGLTVLQNRLAALSCFSLKVNGDPMKPKAKTQLTKAASASATGTDLTDFEPDDATVFEAVECIPVQVTQTFHITNDELQSGLQLAKLLDVNLAAFCDKIIDLVLAPVTEANFPATPIVSASAAFSLNDMAEGHGQLQKSPIKNAILDGTYFSRIVNTPGMFQVAGTSSGTGWQKFGWDRIESNSRWTGAGENIKGLLCNPQAIVAQIDLPLAPAISGASLSRTVITVPSLEIQVAYHEWLSLKTRKLCASFDVIVAAALGDGTAGVLVKNG